MDIKVVIVLVVLIFLVTALYRDWFRPVLVFLISIVALNLTGVLSAEDTLQGFANKEIAVVLMLIVLAGIIKKLGVIEGLFASILSSKMSYNSFLFKMMAGTSVVSGFINNTPLVAIMIPYVSNWAKRKGITPSRVLIPLSYATILGGTLTLIGTSTNLIVNSLVIEEKKKGVAQGISALQNMQELQLFDFTSVGFPLLICGIIYLMFASKFLLPNRPDAIDEFKEHQREYLVQTVLKKNSVLAGKTIEEANLRHLPGLFLVEIIRRERRITPVGPQELIEEEDVLMFAGATGTVLELVSTSGELVIPEYESVGVNGKQDVVEVVISNNSQLIDKKVKETDFRGLYDAAIVAIHRNGEKLSGKIGEMILKPGDLLLLITGKDFKLRISEARDIYTVSKVMEINRPELGKSLFVLLGTLAAIVLSAMQVIPLFQSLLILVLGSIFLKIINLNDLKKIIDFDLILILAFALAISKAIVNTGTATYFSSKLITLFEPLGIVGILLGVYLITTLLTEIITNAAAASIVFPIAIQITLSLGLDPKPFVLAIAFAGSASFATPFGYQTNLMVYGPGGYKFSDFLRIGIPLNVISMIVTVSLLAYYYNLY